ncbi:MAG: methyltransferase domain-containing protein [Anaerolineales bacterium]
MTVDPYRRVAGIYDRLFEPMNKGLRLLGFRMYLPPRGGSVLDVGCGTGVHLEMYRKFKCNLTGIDTSASMLERARTRLGPDADLRLANGTQMPFEDGHFDLVLCMLALHEMDDEVRIGVMGEIRRVLKPEGRALLIDFHAGRPGPLRGWLSKLLILLSEVAAGRRHFSCYRHFMSIGGLPSLITRGHFEIERSRVVGEGTLALYLVRAT